MYLEDIAAVIRSHIPTDRMPTENANELLLSYAVLLRAKGRGVTQSDIHDAWSAWMSTRSGEHESLVPFEDLDSDVKAEDQVFATAVHKAADQLELTGGSRPGFIEILFPSGPPSKDSESQQALGLYKTMVDSSEALVGRRQAVNTFFLTMNGALLTASGLIVQGTGPNNFEALGIAVLSVAGVILCAAWRSLITSFGQLNRGKFMVINTMEQYLAAAIYAAEWEALGRGEDPKVYRSFTSREIWVPNALLVLHSLAVLFAGLVAAGCISLGAGTPAA